MWYNSFRHLVKRSNRIHIQKKLLVLLQEAQLIYVVNFLYIFPLISLPCCPLSPFFFTTLRNSDVPAATSTGGECLQWCQPWLPSSGSQQCVLLQQSALPSEPPWEPPRPWVPCNHTPSAGWRPPCHLTDSDPSPSVLHGKQHQEIFPADQDAFTSDVVLQALAFIRAQIPVLTPNASALVSDDAEQGNPGRGWAWRACRSHRSTGTHTGLGLGEQCLD